MDVLLALVGAAALAAAAPVVARVRREYEDGGTLSVATVAAVWILYVGIAAVVTAAAALGTWPIGLPGGPAAALGLFLLAAGLALELAGLASMASFRRMSGLQPDELITAGAFRYSRNPQNAAMAIAMTGAALLGDSWLALVLAAGFWLFFYVYVRFEEQHLGRVFGERYERYRRHTPRFLGLPRRGPPVI
jgi:protein-S-isoprenylcysteine O-methyltransferase Ste14